MKVILLLINLATIILMLVGSIKLKRGMKSQIANALFLMMLCLCAEISISGILVITHTVDFPTLAIRTSSRLLELLGTLWFMRSIFKGQKFIEVMLYREQRPKS